MAVCNTSSVELAGETAVQRVHQCLQRNWGKCCGQPTREGRNSFDFVEPHLDADKRCARMQELWDDPERQFGDLDLKSCGDKSVWKDLERYIKRHATAFRRQPS